MAGYLHPPRCPRGPACRQRRAAPERPDSACRPEAWARRPSDIPATARAPAPPAKGAGPPRSSYDVIIPVPLQNFHWDAEQVRERLGVEDLVLRAVAKDAAVADQ